MRLKEEQFEHHYIEGRQIDIHYIAKGDKNGIPVIFLHGITSNATSFWDVLNRMPEKYYTISVDIRGRGKSGWPRSGYKMDDYVEDLLDVINAFTWNPISPILVAHSMGARISAQFAAHYSPLISGMVLIDPPIHGPGQRKFYPNSLSMFIQQQEAVQKGDMELFRKLLPPHFTDEQVEERAEEYKLTSRHALIESYDEILRGPFQAYIKMSKVPMLLLAAELGDTIRTEELQVLKNMNPLLEAVVVKGAGHMVYKEAPEETFNHIMAFVQKVMGDH